MRQSSSDDGAERRRLKRPWRTKKTEIIWLGYIFSSKKWTLHVNICFPANGTKGRYLIEMLWTLCSYRIFWCFHVRTRLLNLKFGDIFSEPNKFNNLVRKVPCESKSHKSHATIPFVFSCCCFEVTNIGLQRSWTREELEKWCACRPWFLISAPPLARDFYFALAFVRMKSAKKITCVLQAALEVCTVFEDIPGNELGFICLKLLSSFEIKVVPSSSCID